MATYNYQIRDGFRLRTPAEQVGKALLALHQKGPLTPESLLNAARSAKHPLHGEFTWDDGRAAELYRLQEARYVIRAVAIVEVRSDGGQPQEVRAFVHAEPDTPYVPIAEAMGCPETRHAILERALHELQAWRKRYAALKEFAKVFEAVDSVQLPLPLPAEAQTVRADVRP